MSEAEVQDTAYFQDSNGASLQPEGGTWIQCFDEESGYPYLYNSETGETKWVDADTSNDLLVTLWQKFYDDNGDEFYYNPHTGESSWELPQNAVLEESENVAHEDQQFADTYDEENIEYDGAKYIEMFSPSVDVERRSTVETGIEDVFDVSLEASMEQVPNYNQLGQSSVHSTRSTKSASYIPMKLLVKKNSHEGMMEKKTSFGSLGMMEKKHSAQSLGIKNGSAFLLNRTPIVKDNLKPQTPQSGKIKLSGFALLKVGASVLRRQIDEHGSTWLEYQAADNGPVFYAEESGESAGQWNRPHVFDLDDFSSASIVSVEPVDFNQLDDALVSRPSSRQNLRSLVPGAGAESGSTKSGGAYAPPSKTKIKIVHAKPAEEPPTEERKSLFGSFINSVFVDTVAKEDQVKPSAINDMGLDALFVFDDDDGGEESPDSPTPEQTMKSGSTSEKVGNNNPATTPALTTTTATTTGSLGLHVSISTPGPPGSVGELFLGGGLDLAGLDSPAERIALTPVRKLPPGSGMRKASFSQLNYIPESLLEEKEVEGGVGASSAELRVESPSPRDTPLTNEGVGAGMAAVRAMYLSAGFGADTPPAAAAVDLKSEDAAVESPEANRSVIADLFDSMNAESQMVPEASIAPPDNAVVVSEPEPEPKPESEDPVAAEVLPEMWIQCYDEESGWPYVYNEATGEVKWVEPESTEQLMAELWEVCYDEDGNQFYYNPTTGESSWELPENAKIAEGGRVGAGAWIDGTEVAQTSANATVADGLTVVITSSTSASFKASGDGDDDTPMSPSLVSMKKLTSKASMQSMVEKKTSVGNLTPLAKKASAANLGIKTGSAWIKSKAPEIKDSLKPTTGTPKVSKSSLSGFALLKVGAKVLDKQIDEDGAVWVQYQAVDKGPVFYAEEGAESAGQWHRPPIFEDGLHEEEVGRSVKLSESVDEMKNTQANDIEVPDVAELIPGQMPDPQSTVPSEAVLLNVAPAAVLKQKSASTLPPKHPVEVSSIPIPPLPLEPIISQQIASSAVSFPTSQANSLDLGLFELSGLSMDSKPTNKESQELGQSSHQSLEAQLKALGLDEDDDEAAIPHKLVPAKTLSQSPAGKQISAQSKKVVNIEAKLEAIARNDTVNAFVQLIESPYKAKVSEKSPVKVANGPATPTTRTATESAPASNPTKPEIASSPPREPFQNKVVRRQAQSNSTSIPALQPAFSPGKSAQRRGSDRESSFGGSLDRLEAADSSYNGQYSAHMPEFGSPVAGGAVKSSFLTDLGFASADMSALDETYLPPRGVAKLVLMEELERGNKLDTALRQVASEDQNEDEAAILLRRLQKVATGGGVPGTIGASRPFGAPREDSADLHLHARKVIERTCLLLERIEESSIEHKVNHKQLLEAVLGQRAMLVTPRSLVRDQKAHNSLPAHCCSPQGVKYPQVEHKLEVMADAGAWLLCKDPFFLHGKFFYVNKTTRFLQAGEPFDFQMKKNRKSLRKENWNEFDLNLSVNQHRLENSQTELLRDHLGGLLVYSPSDDQYSSTGKFDANWAARTRLSSTQGNLGIATAAARSHFGATINSRTTTLMNQGSLPVFTHQRPASASAATRGSPGLPSRGLSRSHSGVQDLFRRKGPPTNVWTTLALESDGHEESLRNERFGLTHSSTNNGFMQGTTNFAFTSDFAALDQTAASFEDDGTSRALSDNFFTLKNAFASNNEEEMLEDRNHDFSSPYFDTEMMLELARTKGQVTDLLSNCILVYYLIKYGAFLFNKYQTDPQSMLAFEKSMDPDTYSQYHKKILAAAAEPENPVPLLELMELLVLEGLGKQAFAALKRAVVVMAALSEWSLSAHELAVCRLLSIKMASKYYLRFEKPATVYALVDSFPESPLVLSHAALYFHSMKYVEQAELLFVGALMLNPSYERALLGYSRLLAEKGNYRAALKYLSRVEEDSPLWIAAKLDMAGIQELQGADSGALINAYKNCLYHQALHKDRVFSVAQHCIAYQYQKLQDSDKADFFSGKAIHNNQENSIALLLSALAAAAALGRARGAQETPSSAPRRPGTAGIAAAAEPAFDAPLKLSASKEEVDAKYRSGILLLPKHQYRWLATLGYADFVCCVMQDTHRAEQYYTQASKISFSYSIWSTIALVMFHQYVRGEAGVAGRLLLRTLRHRHADVPIDCLTDFNAFKHREVDQDPVNELIKFMSLPNPQSAGATLREDIDDLEIAALYVVIAFYLMDLQEWEEAMKYAAAAIRISETYSPALRCIALITWQHGSTRKVSLRYFAAALEFGRSNPSVLRTCAVIKALEGYQEEALSLMESAVAVGPNCPLSFRALGLMMYLYRKDDVAALNYLSRAFSLSNEEDIECLRLRGQILMDSRKFKEARAVFQQALYIVPWDPVCLASLAYCVGMTPHRDAKYKSMGGSVSYHSRLMTMRSFEELIHSRDAEELFEASVTMDLQKIFAGQANLSSTGTEEYAKMKGKRAMNPFSQSNGMVLSNFAVENELEEVDTDFGSNMTGYAYFWYGMHEMNRAADSVNPDKARTLFSLSSKVGAPNAASSTSAQALYMLGVLAEREEDFETAERHYTQAVQCEPMEPIALLRLSTLVEEGLSNIKKLIRHIENNPRRRKSGKKLKKKSKKVLVDSFGTVSTYRPSPKKSGRNSVLVDNLAELLSKPLIDAHEDDDPRHEQDDSDAMDLDAVDALNDYQRRLLMHQRIHEMIVLKKQSYRKLLSKSLVVNSSHHVFVDSYWLERLLHSFSACDDWAMLYRCAQQVKPVKRKAKTEQPTKHK